MILILRTLLYIDFFFVTSSSTFMFYGGSYTSVFLILLGVSLTHVVNYLIHCIIFIYYIYIHILNCTVIFCLYYNYMGRIKIILILINKRFPYYRPALGDYLPSNGVTLMGGVRHFFPRRVPTESLSSLVG